MDTFEFLQKKMYRSKLYERPGILLGVYKQLVVSNKGHQSNGEYRTYSEASKDNRKKMGTYVYEQLKHYGAENSAQKLYDQVLKDLVE
ncbi:MAG: hypothetical protein JW789_00225 [Candidatus Aenigmarchaeota archaeon]|nr:hypothetical protein [Candidatus Aenigmarchaeota archaeon]